MRCAIERHQLPITSEHLRELFINVGIREFAHRPIELEAFPRRHVELGPYLNRELERHRPIFGHFDRFQIKVRFADCREPLLFADLF